MFKEKYWCVVKSDGRYAGVPCLTEEEAYELAYQHPGSAIFVIELQEIIPEEPD